MFRVLSTGPIVSTALLVGAGTLPSELASFFGHDKVKFLLAEISLVVLIMRLGVEARAVSCQGNKDHFKVKA